MWDLLPLLMEYEQVSFQSKLLRVCRGIKPRRFFPYGEPAERRPGRSLTADTLCHRLQNCTWLPISLQLEYN